MPIDSIATAWRLYAETAIPPGHDDNAYRIQRYAFLAGATAAAAMLANPMNAEESARIAEELAEAFFRIAQGLD